jgi:hypothetical protein
MNIRWCRWIKRGDIMKKINVFNLLYDKLNKSTDLIKQNNEKVINN